MIIIIPSRYADPTAHMLESAQLHLDAFGLKSIVLALGSTAVRPWHASAAVVVIPLPVLKPLLELACAATSYARTAIFGLNIPWLGFGGSSNVTLLVGLLLDRPWWVKLDDDCRIIELGTEVPADGTVGAGLFHESVPHPKDLLIAAYPHISSQLRLNNAQWVLPVPTLKNGALLMSSVAAAQAPYPVLHSAQMGLSLRGEVYDWVGKILDAGISVVGCPRFQVRHYRTQWFHNEWITQLMLKADIVLASRARRDGVRLSERMRHQNLTSALSSACDLVPDHFSPLHAQSHIYHEALALSTRATRAQAACDLGWRRIAARTDELRGFWIRRWPALERDLFAWV